MNTLENIEHTLEEWGQNLRGGSPAQGLQPRDVLHAVLGSLEENRVEGLDHKIYAPNTYTVELHLDEEERSRLLPFLGHEELEESLQRYCQERKYHFRGPLALDIIEAGPSPQEENHPPGLDPRGTHPAGRPAKTKKVIVISRFNVPKNWESDLASHFVTPESFPPPLTEHDLDRRSPPTYAGSNYRS